MNWYFLFNVWSTSIILFSFNPLVRGNFADKFGSQRVNNRISFSFLSSYLPFCPSIRLPFCLGICWPFCLAMYLPFCLPICLPFFLSICLHFCLYICLTFFLSVRLPFCPCICLLLSASAPACLLVYPQFYVPTVIRTITTKSYWNIGAFLRFSESFLFLCQQWECKPSPPVKQCENASLLLAELFISPSHNIVLRGRGFCSSPLA